MKRFLAALGLLALYCWFERRHNARRHPFGGFRCIDCHRPLADLREARTLDEPGVNPWRIQGPRRRPSGVRAM